jgi:hypothetical protein
MLAVPNLVMVSKINTFPTNIAVIHINELAWAKVMCEIPGDFRRCAKPKFQIGPAPERLPPFFHKCEEGRAARFHDRLATPPNSRAQKRPTGFVSDWRLS